ncbi:MAG: dihydropteroate synthase [Saprospiraceae bacterium]|jgi:dihydropteroate synthase|tara:strand:- start:43 stop:891 length:849 start_codon:yes stop_codon:yes gene_type:complete
MNPTPAIDVNFPSPRVMAVLNVTPDSFFDGGVLCDDKGFISLDLALKRVEAYLNSGADIIDVGGESTRPGATPVSENQELDRVIPVVEAIVTRFGVPVSVDTSSPLVIKESANAGAVMINDVRALSRKGAVEAVFKANLSICLMHMMGEPSNMQVTPGYGDVLKEVKDFLLSRISACESAGISREKIFVDPGFGFGKTLKHNLTLFRGLSELSKLGFPLVVGLSRKSMIGSILDKPANERIFGSVALAMLAVQRGAHILRVHDVAATVDVLKILHAVEGVYD